MPTLTWDTNDVRNYHTGIDLGVLYDSDSGRGIPWNGLVSVTETTAPTLTSFYFDGNKVGGEIQNGEYLGVLSAYTYPDEFAYYDGSARLVGGVYLTGQNTKSFGLCYRTRVEHMSNERPTTYKVHILYNVRALPGQKIDATISSEIAPSLFTWNLSATPEDYSGFRPTAHIVIDERHCHPELWTLLSRRLYGYTDHETDSIANLPPFEELMEILKSFWEVLIIDNKDGTWILKTRDDDVLTVNSPVYRNPQDSEQYGGGIFTYETDHLKWLDEEKTHFEIRDSRGEPSGSTTITDTEENR